MVPPHADTTAAASSPPPLLLSMTKWQYRSKAGLSQPEKTEGLCSLQQCVNINHIPAKPQAIVKTSGSKPSFKKRNKTKTNNKNNTGQTTTPLLLGLSHPSRSSERLWWPQRISAPSCWRAISCSVELPHESRGSFIYSFFPPFPPVIFKGLCFLFSLLCLHLSFNTTIKVGGKCRGADQHKATFRVQQARD